MTRSQQEHYDQVALIQWFDLQYPDLTPILAIPNGGHRHKAVAGRMKAEGVRAGVPDLLLPIARGGYHGLWIEMKTAKGRLTPEQRWWMERLRTEGYRVEMCRGFEEALAVVTEYLALEASEN